MRGLTVGIGCAAILVAGVAGCSSKDNTAKTEGTSGPSPKTSVSASVSVADSTAKVSIDGQPQDVSGQVVCSTMGGNLNIAIGQPGTGLAVVMAPDASRVTSVGLGNVSGTTLGYQEGAPGGNASATKDGNSYTVTGTATGVDMANPMQPVTKPFEIKVTCP